MENKNKEENIFYDLTPINDIELGIYEEAINFSLRNDKILNIAISGSYGSGKSSLLESYKKEHPEKNFLHISLTHFNSMENRINIKEKNIKGNSNIEQDNSEENDNKRTKNLTVALEAKILNQMLHQILEKNIPLTDFKMKGKFSKLRLVFSTIFILIFILSFFQIIFFNQWHNFITGLYHIKYMYKVFKISTYPYFKLISGIILFIFLGIFIYKILKFQKTKNFLKKLNIQGNEFEIAGDNEDSYFDKYLNEVIYLFENSGVEAIVFEDIDRYEISEIFERLREINKLVNNKLKNKKNNIFLSFIFQKLRKIEIYFPRKRRTLKFFYLLRDDIFISKDRTKFFDFIIPVIPVIDSSNSYDKIIELLKKDNQYNLNQDFLFKLSLYIDDMRLLKNICNEFKIYHKKLRKTKINSNKMFGIIVYKNLFPKDFSNLQLNKGFIYNLFSQKDKFIENETKEINFQIEKLNQQKNEIIESTQELEMLYNACLDARRAPYNSNYNEINNWINDKYSKKKEILENKKDKTIPEIQENIDNLNKRKNKLQKFSLKEIITRENIENIFDLIKKEFKDVKENDYFRLLKFLVREGYLDETYSYYMTYFYENSLTRSDKNFLIAVTDKEKLEYNYKLDTPNLVIKRLREVDFEEIEILNFDLLNYLLKNNKEKSKQDKIFTQLKDTKNFEFVNLYLKLELEENIRKKFTISLNSIWKTFFSEAKNNKDLWEDDIHMYAIDILQFSEKNFLNLIDKNNHIKEYIENKEDFLNFEIFTNKYIETLKIDKNFNNFLENLRNLDIKFKKIEYFETVFLCKKTLDSIYENNMYEVNFENIVLMIKKILYEDVNLLAAELITKNYTLIKNGKNSKHLQSYLKENINKYIETILEKSDTIKEDEEIIIELLNHKDIEKQNKRKYINALEKKITTLLNIEDRELWEDLLNFEKVNYSEENIITYFEEKGVNDTLINFINSEKNKLSYKNFNFDDKEIKSTFFKEILKCYELKNKIYKNILENLDCINDKIQFPEDIPKEKIYILINLNIIKMNLDNLNLIRTCYNQNLEYFIKFSLEKYLEIMDNNIFSQNELLMILSDKKINEKIKIQLLKFTKQSINIINKSYSDKVQEYILENGHYSSDELPKFIKKFNNFSNSIKEEIFRILVKNVDNFCKNLEAANFELIKKFLKNKEIDSEVKLTILINLLNFIKEIEKFYKYLKLVNSKDYKDLVKRNTSFNISINEFNLQLLEKLKEKRFIESFSQINETIYEVVTIKDKEKFID